MELSPNGSQGEDLSSSPLLLLSCGVLTTFSHHSFYPTILVVITALEHSAFPTPQPTLPPNFDASACKRLITNDFPNTELIPLIGEIFTSKDEIKMIGDLPGDAAQTFIDIIHEVRVCTRSSPCSVLTTSSVSFAVLFYGSPSLDQALDRANLPSTLRKKCLSALCKICGRHALLPKSLRVSLSYDRSGLSFRQGGFADVWMGEYQGSQVAVKVLRVSLTSDFQDITKVGAQGL